MNSQQLNEGLRPLDLKEMVHSSIGIDSYKSKMGEDDDVCVVSFKVKDRAPANDLMEFIEKGFNFVLDADVSSGENNEGNYFVFVELERSKSLPKQIKDLTDSVERLTGIKEWKFNYYKGSTLHEANIENFEKIIPKSSGEYEGMISKVRTESIKNFFSKTLMDDLTLDNSIITIHKPFDKKIKLKIIDEEANQSIVEGAPSVDDHSIAEIFWLTKVLGDYNISKFGDSFLFSNDNKQLLLQRAD
jgi:hypothetical protein